MDLELKGKKVFITASSSGIGYASARAFLQEGATVVISGRDCNKLESAVEALKKEYVTSDIYGIQMDATKADSLKKACIYIKTTLGRLDCLVGNLGCGKSENKNIFDIYEWRRLFDINLFSAVQLIDSFKEAFDDNGGSIILMSSIAGMSRIGAPVAYAASKAGLNILVSYASKELVSSKIRINAVAPGNVFFKGGRWEELMNADVIGTDDYIRTEVPMNRFATPEEIANAVVFLSSARSSFTTGAVLVVDGGQCRVV